jgi:hypothetical protein
MPDFLPGKTLRFIDKINALSFELSTVYNRGHFHRSFLGVFNGLNLNLLQKASNNNTKKIPLSVFGSETLRFQDKLPQIS